MTNRRQKRAVRLQLMLTREEIEFIDHWRFDQRMPSRSAAVRALLRYAVEANALASGQTQRRVSSAEVGILPSGTAPVQAWTSRDDAAADPQVRHLAKSGVFRHKYAS